MLNITLEYSVVT